jgi:hypothetical protein
MTTAVWVGVGGARPVPMSSVLLLVLVLVLGLLASGVRVGAGDAAGILGGNALLCDISNRNVLVVLCCTR